MLASISLCLLDDVAASDTTLTSVTSFLTLLLVFIYRPVVVSMAIADMCTDSLPTLADGHGSPNQPLWYESERNERLAGHLRSCYYV